MQTVIPQSKVVNVSRVEDIKNGELITEISELKQLLCTLVCEARDKLECVPVAIDVKSSALFELYTGSQECGYVEGVLSLDAVEGMIIASPKLVKARTYHAKDGATVQVYEMELAKKYRAFSDSVSFREAYEGRLMPQVRVYFNPENDKIRHAAHCSRPIPTTKFHFVVVSKNGVMFMDRWEPGSYFAPGEQKVILGDINIHSKRKHSVFSPLWDTITEFKEVEQRR